MAAFNCCAWPTASLEHAELQRIVATADAHGAALRLATCQRQEVYGGAAECDCGAPVQVAGADAVHRLAEVAAGLDAIVVGEREVLGQVRGAVAEAPDGVRPFAEIAVAAARELRRTERLDGDFGGILDLAIRTRGIRTAGALLVVGTGAVARAVATRGAGIGFASVVVAGRSEPAWLDHERHTYLDLAAMRDVEGVSVVAGCLGKGAGELEPTEWLPPDAGTILDLGTPRNFGRSPTHEIITLAELAAEDTEAEARRKELRTRLAVIIERRLEMATSDSTSSAGQLRLHVERVRQHELQRITQRHPDIPGETLDAITRSLVNRLFHVPSVRLRSLGDERVSREVVALFTEGEA